MHQDIIFTTNLSSEKRFKTRKILNNLSKEVNYQLDDFQKKLSTNFKAIGFNKNTLNKQDFIDFLIKTLNTGSEVNFTFYKVLTKTTHTLLTLGSFSITKKKIITLEGSIEMVILYENTLEIQSISFSPRFIIN